MFFFQLQHRKVKQKAKAVIDSSHMHNGEWLDSFDAADNSGANFIRNTARYGFADNAPSQETFKSQSMPGCTMMSNFSLLDAQSMVIRKSRFLPAAVTPPMERSIHLVGGGCVIPDNNRNKEQPGTHLSLSDECHNCPSDPTPLAAPFLSSSFSFDNLFSVDLFDNSQPWNGYSSRSSSVRNAVSGVLPDGRHCTGSDLPAKPSDFLRARVLNAQESSQPPQKKIKTQSDDALHRACLQSNVSLQQIKKLLNQDPEAATRSIPIFSNKRVENALTRATESRVVKEPFTYPLHLAIQTKVNPQIIQDLINAAPQVLLIPDGAMKETPLHILLKQCPDVKLVDSILLTQPKCVVMRDRHDNTVVHLAVNGE